MLGSFVQAALWSAVVVFYSGRGLVGVVVLGGGWGGVFCCSQTGSIILIWERQTANICSSPPQSATSVPTCPHLSPRLSARLSPSVSLSVPICPPSVSLSVPLSLLILIGE